MRHIRVALVLAIMVALVACGIGGVADPSGSGVASGADMGGASSTGGLGGGSGGDTSGGGDANGAADGAGGGGVIAATGSGDDPGGSSGDSAGSSSGDSIAGSSGGSSSNGSPAPGSPSSETTTPNTSNNASADTIPAQTERLQIVNKCTYTIWIQQQNMPAGTPSVIELAPGGSAQWAIPAEGLAATRLWPKMGCDSGGNNCLMGQSSGPCPEAGCPPPVDSKFEATWGCTLADVNQCAPNPSAPWQKLSGDTYWNTSAVDGYTFPFTASVTDNTLPANICSPVDCSALTMDQCPTTENLSVGVGGAISSQYSSVDLRLRNQAGALMGCYAPCTKMTYPTYGGYWLSNVGTEAAMYCCPTPPIGPSECSSGPVESTQFVARVRSMCGGTVYTYAYDDGNGLRQCSGATKVRLIIGPNCP